MRIDRVHIDRFGIIADQDIPSLSAGLTCFLGRNEAGKSTCLRFFRSMLFGYKRGRSSLDPMTGRGGGLAGGSLWLTASPLGDIILTRRPGPHGGMPSLADHSGAPLPDRGESADVLLSRLFSGMTMDVYDAIFAFSLRELMEFSSFSGEKVRHALHGAAFGHGLLSPAQALKRLDDRMSALLKAERGSAAINNIWRELKTVRDDLVAREPELAQYSALSADLDALDAKLAGLREARDAQEMLLRRSRRRGDVWNHWAALGRIDVELDALGLERPADLSADASSLPGLEKDAFMPLAAFAPDAAQRLDALLTQKEERLLAVSAHERTMARLDDDISDIGAPDDPAGAKDLSTAVQTLREQKEGRRAEAESLPALEAECVRLETAQQESLATLGPGWSAARIASANLSLAREKALLDKGEQARGLAGRLERLTDDRARLTEEQAEALCQEEAAAKGILPMTGEDLPDKMLTARIRAALAEASPRLAELPALLERRERARTEAEHARADFDPALTLEGLRGIDCSKTARRDFETAAVACLAAARSHTEAERDLRFATERVNGLLLRVNGLRTRLATRATLPDADTLAARKALLRNLRNALAECAAAERPLEESRRFLAAQNPEDTQSHPRPLVAPAFIAGVQLALAGLALTAGGLIGSSPSMIYAGATMIVLGLPLGLLYRFAVYPARQKNRAWEFLQENVAQAEKRLADAQNNLQELGAQSTGSFEDPFSPDPAWLDRAEASLEAQSHALALAGQEREKLLEAEGELEAAQREAHQAESVCCKARDDLQRANSAYAGKVDALGLSRPVPAEEAGGLFETVAACLVRAGAADEAAERVRQAATVVIACLELAREHPFFDAALPDAKNSAHSPDLLFTEPGALEQPANQATARARLAALTGTLNTIDEQREREQERQRLISIHKERQEARERVERRLAQAQNAEAETRNALAEAWNAWNKALADFDLPAGMRPENTAETLALMRAFNARDKEISARRARLRGLEDALAAFAEQVLALAERIGLACPAPVGPNDDVPPSRRIPAILALLDSLIAKTGDAAQKTAQRLARVEQMTLHAQNLQTAREALAFTESALAALFDSVGADNAESFRSAFARHNRIESLRRDRRERLEALRALAAEEKVALDALLASLAQSSPEDLQREQVELDASFSDLDRTMAELAQQRGALLERRAVLAGCAAGQEDDSASGLRLREAALRDELHRLSRQWAVPALARQLLLAAKERFEREGRQGALRHAGDMFRAMTNGEYTGVALALDGESFAAMHHSGDLREPEKQLSQGTREQLYLALRLAFIKNHADNSSPMPVVMDDILVNFDPERSLATAKVLADFAGHNQTLFFTCHPATAEMLMATAGNKAPEPLLYHINKGIISA